MLGLLVRGCVGDNHDGLGDAKGGGPLTVDKGILDLISFELTGEVNFQAGVRLGVGEISRVGEATKEVGCCNHTQCPRNRLFPKSVHTLLGVLRVSDPVPIDLEDFDTREGCTMESRVG